MKTEEAITDFLDKKVKEKVAMAMKDGITNIADFAYWLREKEKNLSQKS